MLGHLTPFLSASSTSILTSLNFQSVAYAEEDDEEENENEGEEEKQK